MRLQVDGVEHPSVASYARGLQKEAWLMVAAGAVVANSTRHWMAKVDPWIRFHIGVFNQALVRLYFSRGFGH